MMDESEQLHKTVGWRTKQQPNGTVKLGDAVKQLMESCISPRQARFGSVAELWSQLLPDELQRHCRIIGISGGRLKVLVDSPSYASELRWCGSDILEEIKQQCPRAKIERIEFVIG